MEKEKLEKQYKVCKAMATACRAKKDFLLEKFYRNAAEGFKAKMLKA